LNNTKNKLLGGRKKNEKTNNRNFNDISISI